MQAVIPKRSPVAELVAEVNTPMLFGGIAFLVLFWSPLSMTLYDWWNEPDAGHGLLLFPIALYLLWKSGISPRARPQIALGIAIMIAGVLLRYLSGLAAEWFTLRWSVLISLAGLIIFKWGLVQIRHWWLPIALLILSVPLPTILLNTIAFPLQLKASQMGAALLEWRHVNVFLSGNVIELPGRSLFVTEACSGLRSLTALISLGVLIGGLWIKTIPGRLAILAITIPVAVVLNGFRVFLTGFLVYFVSPALGEGFLHMTEGWLIFVVALGILGVIAHLVIRAERILEARKAAA